MSQPPRVFISYSHDSPRHMQHVLALADRLRGDGVDAWLDQYVETPAKGWPRWMVEQIESADFVLVVCSEDFSHRFRGTEAAGRGHGVHWETAILTQEFYGAAAQRRKFIPIVFSQEDHNHIPLPLRGLTSYVLDSEEGFEYLYRHLTGQPAVKVPPVGRRKALSEAAPTERPDWLPRGEDAEGEAEIIVEPLPDSPAPEGLRSSSARHPVALEDFIRLVPWGRALVARCEQDGSRPTDLRSIGAGRWLLSTAIPTSLQESYGTAPEVLVVAVEGEVQGGDLEQARRELYQHPFDLDLLVVVDARPNLPERLERMFQVEGQWVPWIRKDDAFPPLAETFRRYLPTQDVFERTGVVRGRQVIGRAEVIAELSRRLVGTQAVGIFGLRKMGKTTVVRAATDRLDPISARLSLLPNDGRWVADSPLAMRVAWLDAGRAHERTLDAVAGRLQRALERRLAAEELLPPGAPSPPSLSGLDRLLEYTLRTADKSVALVIDEYDLLFEGSGGQPAVPDLEKLFQLLRGHAQETARLALVVIGRDPTFFERPEMGGRTNPMLGWFVNQWLGPLPPSEADTLLEKLGRRVALDIGMKTRELARDWTGGHPLLHRQFGSALLQWVYHEKLDFRELTEHIATDPFCDEAIDFFLDRREVLTICREIFHLLSARYPEAADLLIELSRREHDDLARAFTDRDAWHRPAARILRDFGILLAKPRAPQVPQALAWYLRAVETRQRVRA